MTGKVLIIGAGDVGQRIARGLAQSGELDELVFAGLCQGRGPALAALLSTCFETRVRFSELDATRQADVEALLRNERPDVLVQSAALLSPWTSMGRRDAVVDTLIRAGLGVHLPAQLPILLSVVRAVKTVGLECPIANLSLPDATHPILERLGLAPTIGLGNVSIQLRKVRARLRERLSATEPLPLARMVAHHQHVTGVMSCKPPSDPEMRARVYLGEEGARDDELAYTGTPLSRAHLPPGLSYNEITAAATLPVILALLPNARALRYSAPAPFGLPDGYPVKIEAGEVELDLPPQADRRELVEFHWRLARGDGIERVEDDGTVIFTEATASAVAALDPTLAEPLSPDDAPKRFRRLAELLSY